MKTKRQIFSFLISVLIILFVFLMIYICFFKSVSKKRYNIMILVIDAARSDHFSFYGYSRKTSPFLDNISKKSYVFENAFTQATWTKPSVASIFTSTYPSRHGTNMYAKTTKSGLKTNVLPDSFITLAEVLKQKGYKNYAVTNNNFIAPNLNFDQGFDRYIVVGPDKHVTKVTIDRLNEIKEKDNFFMYIHYLGPHSPYTPLENFKNRFVKPEHEFIDTRGKHQDDYLKMDLSEEQLNYIISQYDGEILYIDYEIKKIYSKLKKMNVLKDTILVVIADHGEDFLDHKNIFGHGWDPYDTQIRVPLIIHIPGHKPKRIEKLVRLIDIMPTLLKINRIRVPKKLDGRSFKSILKGKNIDLEIFSERNQNGENWSAFSVCFRDNKYKFIYDVLNKEGRLYNLNIDPSENNPISGEKDKKNYYKKKILDYVSKNIKKYNRVTGRDLINLKNKDIKKLKGLGYIN